MGVNTVTLLLHSTQLKYELSLLGFNCTEEENKTSFRCCGPSRQWNLSFSGSWEITLKNDSDMMSRGAEGVETWWWYRRCIQESKRTGARFLRQVAILILSIFVDDFRVLICSLFRLSSWYPCIQKIQISSWNSRYLLNHWIRSLGWMNLISTLHLLFSRRRSHWN